MGLVIGIVGGIGSGKSAVSSAFADRGAFVLDADQAGHEALNDPEVCQILIQKWGENAFSSDSEGILRPDRSKIAKIVFEPSENGKKALKFLNETIHPVIRKRLREDLQRLKSENYPLIILDAPLLFEASCDSLCDRILFVDTDEEERFRRVQKRGWSREEFKNREKSQLSLEKKRKKADCIIDNNQTYERMVLQIEDLIGSLNKGN
ncbi:MAG: dephospho-CoA kinase [Planctomycetia bacterium]|nr:dephospho-CoA kinase [Planctomycetia bacterium]